MTSRHAAGTPVGGRFAPEQRTEPSVTLDGSRPAELVGVAALKDRHPAWTTAAVKTFLGDPDKEVANPVIRGRGKMRLYLSRRAADVEGTEAWQDWVAAYTRRMASRHYPERQPTAPVTGHGRTGTYLISR
jgi:hypothetical protein